MEYNTNRENLHYREYGRSVVKMMEFVCGMETGERREEATRALVGVMGMVGGLSLNEPGELHKLWIHLMLMCDFKLADAWPYGEEELILLKGLDGRKMSERGMRLPYKSSETDNGFYGVYIQEMMHKLKDMPDGEEYELASNLVVQQTKRLYLAWNGVLPSDDIIVNFVEKVSGDERIGKRFLGENIVVNPMSIPADNSFQKKKKRRKR